MKKISLYFALFVASLIMLSCDKTEGIENDPIGVYNPNKKISKVYHDFMGGGKELSQIWNWDGNKLKSIDHYSVDEIIEISNYKYDEKNRVSRVYNEFGEYTDYYYDDDKLKRAIYNTDQNQDIYDFVYEQDKIKEINLKYCSERLSRTHNVSIEPLSIFFTDFTLNNIKKSLNQICSKDNEEVEIRIELKWDGDNIQKIIVTEPDSEEDIAMTITYKYDDKFNPYKNYSALYVEIYEDGLASYIYSKNNVVEEIYNIEYEGMPLDEGSGYQYLYTYDGDVPMSVVINGGSSVLYYEYK